MSRWLSQALAEIARPGPPAPENAHDPRVPLVPLVPLGRPAGAIGTIGTIGTVPQADIDERVAVVEIDGGMPAVFSEGFARLQLSPRVGLSVLRWLQVVDDAGRFLDAFGAQAAAFGWVADDLFGRHGLVLALNGAVVLTLTASTATLSDGRTFNRIG